MPRIALALHRSSMLYEAAIAAEVFGVDRSELSPPASGTTSWSAPPTAPRTRGCRTCRPRRTRRSPGSTPWSCRPPTTSTTTPTRPASRPCARAHERGVRIASLCTGAFVLAAAGLLDGRVATTHWMHAEDLARRYPQVDVRAGRALRRRRATCSPRRARPRRSTCASTWCTATSARPPRAGSRAAWSCPRTAAAGRRSSSRPPAQPRSPGGLAPTLEWARARLDQPLTVRDLAVHAHLSTRQLARRMHAELQVGPLRVAPPAAHRPRAGAPRTHRRLRRADRRQLRHGHRHHPAPALPPCRRRHSHGLPRVVPARVSPGWTAGSVTSWLRLRPPTLPIAPGP